MKKLLRVLFLLFGITFASISACASIKDKTICFTHIGNSDSPLSPIIVTSEGEGVAWCKHNVPELENLLWIRVYVIDERTVERLIVDIEKGPSSDSSKSKPFGTFGITIHQDNKTSTKTLRPCQMIRLIAQMKEHSAGDRLKSDLTELCKLLIRFSKC